MDNLCSFRTPSVSARFPNLLMAESTRLGGISPAPYDSLNLGLATKDLPENVHENRRLFFGAIGIDQSTLAFSHQIHGNEVLVVNSPSAYSGFDSLITNKRGIFLTVTMADCTPILLFDPVREACAAVHAGWRGTAQKILIKTLALMCSQFATNPKDCVAYVGTCIDKNSFEVGSEVAEHFSENQKTYNPSLGKYFVDLKKANADQLLGAGLLAQNIEISGFSTFLNEDLFFSHRKAGGITGRMLAVVGLRQRA